MLLTFDDAVVITKQLIDYYNSPDSDDVILYMADKFDLKVKPDFTVKVTSIDRNCPECSGCHGGNCILGCYETHSRDDPGKLCYWDQALEKELGTKLIVHEMGHVIYDQVYDSGLPEDQDYDQSEKFAMYMENNFDLNMDYLVENSRTHWSINPKLSNMIQTILIGVAISAASIAIAEYVVRRRKPKI